MTQCKNYGIFAPGLPASGRCAREFRLFQIIGMHVNQSDPQAMFVEAVDRNIPKAVQLLLADPRVNPSANDNLAIWRASENGHAEVVRLLLADPRVDPSAINYFMNINAITRASYNGHVEVVRLLLAHPRVDPSANDNSAIRRASLNGHAEVVQLLLADGRADPSANDNEAIRLAIQQGHVVVVQLLWETYRRTNGF